MSDGRVGSKVAPSSATAKPTLFEVELDLVCFDLDECFDEDLEVEGLPSDVLGIVE